MKTKIRVSPVAALIIFTASAAQADSWTCRKADDVRNVNIERLSDGPVPCNVVYSKLTEGIADQVLWNARSDVDYCDEKAAAFVVKLENWGWTCVEEMREDDG